MEALGLWHLVGEDCSLSLGALSLGPGETSMPSCRWWKHRRHRLSLKPPRGGR